jgi:L,D-transpeptidase ErfK/SrfK
MFSKILTILPLILLSLSLKSFALTFRLPHYGNDMVGNIRIVQSKKGDTLHKLARQYEMGFDEIAAVNPKISHYGRIRPHTGIIIPAFFILPNTPHEGIVVNLPEKRLYYYPSDQDIVITEPVTVGRRNWETPQLTTRIIEKIVEPTWYVPKSIQAYKASKGVYLPDYILPGPDNPLGKLAMRLGTRSILIHGTNSPMSIGKERSSGCIRMYPEDIAHLFHLVALETPVLTINQPYKFGWLDDKFYLEAHKRQTGEDSLYVRETVQQAYYNATDTHPTNFIDWRAAKLVIDRHAGIPSIIGE